MSLLSSSAPTSLSAADLIKLKRFITESLTRELEHENPPSEQRKTFITQKLNDIFGRLPTKLPDSIRQQLTQDVMNDVLGYGPIQPLLDDPDVTEVMVNGPKSVYVEKAGHLTKTGVTFENNQEVVRVIERIILPLGRRVDADTPTVDARLPDGSRVNAVIPPVAIDGANITIRKFRKDKLSIQQLIEFGSLTAPMAEFLRACVVSRLNIVISGGTGSGKTTLLNVLSSMIPEDERIVTIEDAAELQLQQDHVVRLETRPPSLEGKGMVTIRDLVRNALRMRPDRIVVGECRGGETLDMLQAMNTGHDGSLTTLHANTPRDSLSRMETMVLMAGMDMPLKVIRQQVSAAIDLIVQQTRLRDGQRKITAVTEVAGMEGDTIVLTDIFRFEQTSITTDGKVVGQMKPTGIRPLFGPRLEASGFKLSGELFGANVGDILKRR
jgi:pilus assembly protein CpaF